MPLSRVRSAVVLLAVALFTLDCGGGGSDAGTPPSTTTIAKAGANSGDAQNGSVGQPLGSPLQALVTENGTPSAGVTVSWSTGVAGGSLVPTSTVTDANGIAASAWTLGTVSGAQTAQAALSGAAGSPVTFTATAAPGPAATLTDAGGNQQTGNINSTLAASVQAKVEDQFGNGVPDIDVAWEAAGATVSSAVVPSNAGGISLVQVTLGPTAGPVMITAAAAGLPPVIFSATAQTPPPAPTTAAVRVGNIFFASNHNNTTNPVVDTVAVGGTVTWTWTNTGATSHSVRSQGPPSFTSSEKKIGNGQTYTATFSTAGTYPYDCAIHGPAMTGKIVVR